MQNSTSPQQQQKMKFSKRNNIFKTAKYIISKKRAKICIRILSKNYEFDFINTKRFLKDNYR